MGEGFIPRICIIFLKDSKDTQGIGLGLPLAKSIIEAHGGSITADSELGAGAAFYLYFPVFHPARVLV